MKRRTFIKHVGLVASVPWLGPVARAATGSSPKAHPGSLRILSCNIRLPQPEDEKSGDGWEARRGLCADVIQAQHADVICLQECKGLQLADLKRRMPGFDSHGLANPDMVFNPQNAILFSRARYELLSAGGFWLSETPHLAGSKSWDSGRPRFANWVHLKERDSNQEFRVWCTHLDHLGQLAREKQAQLVVQAADVFPKEFPQLLAGDMNAGATNPAIKQFTAGGWTDTYAAMHGPKDPGCTFHGFLGPRYADTAKAKNKGKIDWIFYRGAVKPVAAEVIREGRNGRYPSDHYFLSADVMLLPVATATAPITPLPAK